MRSYVLSLQDIDKTKRMIVGGKGANLGELSKIPGLRVPDGFCISTDAFRKIIGEMPSIGALLDQLSLLRVEDMDMAAISEISGKIRQMIEDIAIPQALQQEINQHLSRLGANNAFAVRSSATAEDLPTASFAGQQDTYLNVIGAEALLKHIAKCWASLFTDRAVIYRMQHRFDHRQVYLSVIVQNMLFPQAAGIVFSADPITSKRKLLSIDASFGLGEAVVSGLVSPDCYQVQEEKITHKMIATKQVAIYGRQEGGTETQQLDPAQQKTQTLTDPQILELAHLARQIEAHFGCPQDIEWCLVDDTFHIVQSRPITTLYPIPKANDQESHVYVSVGHQQMMTDPLKPLGMSFYQLTAMRPMSTAGGRLFVDVTQMLASPDKRKILLNTLGKSDPLLKDAFLTLLERGDVIKSTPGESPVPTLSNNQKDTPPLGFQAPIEDDPTIVSDLIEKSQASVQALKQNIQTKSGPELFDFILEDLTQLKKMLFDPQSLGVITTGINASAWLNDNVERWLGEKNVADTLSQSVPNNITSQMGLALLDVADVIRPYPQVIAYLQHAKDEHFLEGLAICEGGQKAQDAIGNYLDLYGMRCAGEIDITNTRWSEQPTILVPMILNHINNFGPGASKQKFAQGRQEAIEKERELVERLKQLPDGEEKAKEAQKVISLIRNVIGYREYPKYRMIQTYFLYKQALLKEATQLAQARVIHEKEDIYYLSFEELREVVRAQKVDQQLICQRKDEHIANQRLTPPRVITSDGEIITGKYKRDNLPANALAGLPVSSGVVEGRARVILRMEDAVLDHDDILVTTFTDPSWTPLFVSIKGLITEVGGLMTHGAVIAREYGLPAVVGVENATQLIKDGQRIRVHGTDGYVEILPEAK